MNEGRYTMRAIGGALGHAKTGTPQIGIELAVTEGDYVGQRIWYYGYFSDAAKEYTFRALRTLGWEGDDLTDLRGIEKNDVTVIVAAEEYNGNSSLKVKGIYPLGGSGVANPMDDAEAKKFAALMKGDAIASRTAGQPAPGENRKKQSKPKPPPSGGASDGAYGGMMNPSDDDIPF
jgi:hypothetical protein